jgi:hypothetical protein
MGNLLRGLILAKAIRARAKAKSGLTDCRKRLLVAPFRLSPEFRGSNVGVSRSELKTKLAALNGTLRD